MEGIARLLAKIQCVRKLFVKMANRRCTLSTAYMILIGERRIQALVVRSLYTNDSPMLHCVAKAAVTHTRIWVAVVLRRSTDVGPPYCANYRR